MNTEIHPFEFNNMQVRVIPDEQGNPWFVVADVCRILEHSKPSMAIEGLDDDQKGVRKVYTLGGDQDMLVVNESGMYDLVIRSNKPNARKFRRWITSEVIPSIRKTGRYIHPDARPESASAPAFVLRAEDIIHRLGPFTSLARLANGREPGAGYARALLVRLGITQLDVGRAVPAVSDFLDTIGMLLRAGKIMDHAPEELRGVEWWISMPEVDRAAHLPDMALLKESLRTSPACLESNASCYSRLLRDRIRVWRIRAVPSADDSNQTQPEAHS